MFRVPIWPVVIQDSHVVGAWQAKGIHVLEHHELAAGKLVALLARKQVRDLFDSHRILGMDAIDAKKLRIAFVVFGAMSRKDWRTVSTDDVEFDAKELTGQLTPMLRAHPKEPLSKSAEYGERLVRECREGLSAVLPFSESERAFLDLLLDRGEVDASILTPETSLKQRIQSQPLLAWKALNVRQHKGRP